MVGERVLFQVKVTGFLRPKLARYHNGEEVVSDYSREIMKDGSLTMPSVEVRHTGISRWSLKMWQERRKRLSCTWRMKKE